MSLSAFAHPDSRPEATITVLDRDEHDPVYRMLTHLFDQDAITIQEATTTQSSASPSNAVLVEKNTEETAFAVSTLEDVRDTLLLVNSDVYVTGTRSLEEVETPEALTALDEIPFEVRGYPKGKGEKLLLIEMSRQIEAMAWRAGEGRIDATFQFLSRLTDERGTRHVYDRLGSQASLDTNVYGVPDITSTIDGITHHGHDTREIRESWVVAYQSDAHPHEAAALIAINTAPGTWEGRWTYDSDQVTAIHDYLDHTYR